MSGHARRVPEASVHPAVCHSCRDRQTRTIVQKVSCSACCQCIQLEWSSLSLSFTPTLQSGIGKTKIVIFCFTDCLGQKHDPVGRQKIIIKVSKLGTRLSIHHVARMEEFRGAE